MDRIIRAVSGDGSAKISAIYGRDLTERARTIHDLTPVASAALGRTLCAASKLILIVFMFFGRVGIMTIGVGFMMGDRARERVQYAETKVMIG